MTQPRSWDSDPPGHLPVMLDEVMAHLAPREGETIVDGTFGAGGYSRAILSSGASVVAIDRDPDAVARARRLGAEAANLTVVEGRFGALDHYVADLGMARIDGLVLDVGVSSQQLDEAGRGFSFRADGPLDMRMGGEGPSAADIVNRAEPSDLAHLLRTYGEERRAGALARAIVEDRPFNTTRELAGLCERVVRSSAHSIHPATRTFQALRIAVNDELGELARALIAAERILIAGGRLVVVAFHSLEDRIVKRFLAERGNPVSGSRHMPLSQGADPSFEPLMRKAVTASPAEVEANPRARSAKLRAARRTAAPPHGGDAGALVPRVRLKGFSPC